MISPGKGLSRVKISRLADGRFVDRKDVVTVEEPLEIRVEFTRNGVRDTSAVSVTVARQAMTSSWRRYFYTGRVSSVAGRTSRRSATARATSPKRTTSWS